MSEQKTSNLLLIVLLAVIGIIVLLFTTRFGIGVDPDSVAYVAVSRNLLTGHGLRELDYCGNFRPFTKHPLFPVLLSIFGIFGIDPLIGDRFCNAFIFGANIFLAGYMIRKYTGSIWNSIFGSFLILTSTDMLNFHCWAMTEPIFLFLSLLALYLVSAYIEHPKGVLLFASSSVSALAVLTRYAGVPLVITGIIGIFFLSKRTHRRKSTDIFIFAAISFLPLAVWLLRNFCVAGRFLYRPLLFHPITYGHIKPASDILAGWFLLKISPDIATKVFKTLILASLLFFSIMLFQYKKARIRSDTVKQRLALLPYLLILFIFFYGLFLIIAISFFDASVALNRRFLSPIFIPGLIFIICLINSRLRLIKQTGAFKVASVLFYLSFAGLYLRSGIDWVSVKSRDGMGYASRKWKKSEIIRQVKSLPREAAIYSNGPDAIYFLTGRPTLMIPAKVISVRKEINYSYLSGITEMEKKIKGRKGVLVYLNKIAWRRYLPSEGELEKILPIRLVVRCADGAIYEITE